MYNHGEVEKKWQDFWKESKTFEAKDISDKPKYYVLDMFPYPSGAGLHVGHPLGYIASDIITRYKRHLGFNVLHPMGYDAFGLPAEQYAIKTGQHPAITTEKNIKRYREQLDAVGLSYDWSREVRTCDPNYYKHTQKTFIELFEHYYDLNENKALSVASLIKEFEVNGNEKLNAHHTCEESFSKEQWGNFNEHKKSEILHAYRLAYQADTFVNWCPKLGTVLANDEVKEGVSVRGGYAVEQKKMRQWCLRISAYADRLLEGLKNIDWPLPLKEMQSNWIGRSYGAEIDFKVSTKDLEIKVFTTRPDTIFGASFMVVAPESDYVEGLVTSDKKKEVEDYLTLTKRKTELERMSDKKVTGVFTGSYCKHPFTGKDIPIWIADYVLGAYGTGAIMAVAAHDSRDYAFAKKFDLPILPIIKDCDVSESAHESKDGTLENSDFLNGLNVKQAISKMLLMVEEKNIGKAKTNYRLRDATFSRQRYWGEPIPIFYKDGIACALDEKELPLKLPEVDAYLPTESGEPPLARAKNWTNNDGYPIELSTMPGFAGSSAYFLRYMDPQNSENLVDQTKNSYWGNVDFYVGGSEHATGHLMYSRFWNMFLFDCGKIKKEEPFQKLINQGMIQGRSNFVYRVKGTNTFVSKDLKDQHDTTEIHVDVNIVKNDYLDLEAFKSWMPEYKDAEFILNEGKYLCGYSLEKMSKSLYNVVNPDDIISQYGADTLRLYEMFLGPVEQSKPWNTSGIEGVSRFLGKLWKLFFDEENNLKASNKEASKEHLKILHTAIKKINSDLESFSLNTAVSAFMICVNDLQKTSCDNLKILKELVVLLSPFAPHICEEIWEKIGNEKGISFVDFPKANESYLIESTYSYPVSLNGKMKFLLELDINLNKSDLENEVLAHERVKKLLDGKTIKRTIIVPKKIINFVV